MTQAKRAKVAARKYLAKVERQWQEEQRQAIEAKRLARGKTKQTASFRASKAGRPQPASKGQGWM